MGLDMYLKAKRCHFVSRYDGSDLYGTSEFSEALKKVPVLAAFESKFPEVVESLIRQAKYCLQEVDVSLGTQSMTNGTGRTWKEPVKD